MHTTVRLTKVEGHQTITRDNRSDFFFELQQGVLLSLKEDGTLNEMQYRHAEKALKEQRNAAIRSKITGGCSA